MKVELTVPSDLSEISLKQYQKFLKLQEKNKDRVLHNNVPCGSSW